ncbi:sigma-70 family RNA polymerase sigma factor [Actinomadura sp. KC216]|uniref:sigma-70 family RNA polymerase sigma factor n=1 Tax=Actinomadura sp. KC216 TaxID=2530370 RepID=UPI001404BB3A|nr:sigma-70 family RNA polymerase sigma factor [Actinomadura sp. KC216]
MKGLNDGDEAALAALYDEYGERVYDYALSMSGDEKVAADIVHDTFIDAGRRAPRMRDHLQLSSWLYGAARRRCIRRGRTKNLYWDRDSDFAEIPFLDRGEPDGPVPDWPPLDELHGLLRACLARLAPVEQEVMLLAHRHGLRPARLGAALGMSSRRAALRVRRSRTDLEVALQKEIHRANRACAAAASQNQPEQPAAASEPSDAADSPEERDEARPTAVAVLAARKNEPPAPAESAPSGQPGGTVPGAPGPQPRTKSLWQVLHRRADTAPVDPSTERHAASCPACLRRGRVSAVALLKRAPAPVLPAALRHRVMHTATDPELAGYRADIAARGGALTPSGLPSQPDVPSPFTRRWLFTGGGMASALAAALAGVFIMGPGIDGSTLKWPPFDTHPQPSITHESPTEPGHGPPPSHGGPGGGGGGPGQAPVHPQTEEKKPEGSASPSPPSSDAPEPRGVLVVPAKVELYGTKKAQVRLAAKSGPVSWTANTSTGQLVLSQTQGSMPEGGTARLTVTLRTTIIGLPGKGTVTFTDSEGTPHTVTVVWGATLL